MDRLVATQSLIHQPLQRGADVRGLALGQLVLHRHVNARVRVEALNLDSLAPVVQLHRLQSLRLMHSEPFRGIGLAMRIVPILHKTYFKTYWGGASAPHRGALWTPSAGRMPG